MDIYDTPSPNCATCLKIREGQKFNVSGIVPTQETCNYCCPPISQVIDISGIVIQPSVDISGNPFGLGPS
jgi:hypothetical protein